MNDKEKLEVIEKEIGLIDLTEKIPEQKMKKEWKKLDKLSLGFDTPTKTRLSVHKIGLKNIKKILECYERKAKIKKTLEK